MAKPQVIRWLGAFGRASSWTALVAFEKAPGRRVSAEAFASAPRINTPEVGLRADLRCVERVFVGDAWTSRDKHLTPEREQGYFLVRDQKAVQHISAADAVLRREGTNAVGGQYLEAVLSSTPRYLSVVVRKNASQVAFKLAGKLSREMNLPVERI